MRCLACLILFLGSATAASAQECNGRWTQTDRDFAPRLGNWRYARQESQSGRTIKVLETLSYEGLGDDVDICLRVRAPTVEGGSTESRVFLSRVHRTSQPQAGTEFTVVLTKTAMAKPGTVYLREVHGSVEDHEYSGVQASQLLDVEPGVANRIKIDLREGKRIALTVNGAYAGTISGPPGQGVWRVVLENETELRDPAASVDGRRISFEHVRITND